MGKGLKYVIHKGTPYIFKEIYKHFRNQRSAH